MTGRYVWRGQAYSRSPVVQPWASAAWNRTTFTLWSNMVLNNEPRRGRFDQLFYSATQQIDRGKWKVEPTLQGYHWQGLGGESDVTTLELSARISHPLGPARIVTSHTLDVARFPGAYGGDAGIEWRTKKRGWDWELSSLAAWANARFNRVYIGADRQAMNYAQVTAAATKQWKGGWYVRPHVEFVTTVSGVIRRAVESKNIFNGGVAIGREF